MIVTMRSTPRRSTWPNDLDAILPASMVVEARATIAAWAGYRPTPILALPGLARRIGVASVMIKHEGERFSVGSFKALGPSYALWQAVQRLAIPPAARDAWTAVAATSGNHGRAVAWAAQRFGLRAIIYMPAHTSAGRESAIRALGAEVVRVVGSFDDALAAALAAAARPRVIVVADIPGPDSAGITRDTLAGYAVLADELVDQPMSAAATHLFIAAGNGSLAAASIARLTQRQGAGRPLIATVEPLRSDVVRQSLARNASLSLDDPGHSLMDGLVVGTPAPLAWPILAACLDAAVAIPDEMALTVLRDLAAGRDGDPAMEIGETGVAAAAGLVAVCVDATARRTLGIDARSRLLAVACEGVTDRQVFDALIASARS